MPNLYIKICDVCLDLSTINMTKNVYCVRLFMWVNLVVCKFMRSAQIPVFHTIGLYEDIVQYISIIKLRNVQWIYQSHRFINKHHTLYVSSTS